MIPILYQDHSLLVCIKHPGFLSQGAPGAEAAMPALLSAQCGGEIYPVHRLDRGAGGVMVFARTGRAAAALSQSVQQGALVKEYLCVVSGHPEAAQGTFRDLLFHDKVRNKTFTVRRPRKGVKEALLDYQVLEAAENLSLVRVRLHTGRTHQIRVQFASRGMPLLGDRKYGGIPGPGLALWSCQLAFPHPDTGAVMEFFQPPDGAPWTAFSAKFP